MMSSLSPDSAMYNTGGYLRILASLDIAIGRQACLHLIQNNQMFAHRLVECYGDQCAYVKDEHPSFEYLDVSHAPDPEACCMEMMRTDFLAPISLKGSACSIKLIRCSSDLFFFYIKTHHAIADGFSFGLTRNFFATAYDQISSTGSAQVLSTDYTDFCKEYRIYAGSGKFKEDEAFWNNELGIDNKFKNGIPDTAQLTPGPSCRYGLKLPLASRARINALCREMKITPPAFFISIYLIVLSRFFPKEHVFIGLPFANRFGEKAKRCIGPLVNVVAGKFNINDDQEVAQLLSAVNAKLHKFLRHSQYPVLPSVKEKTGQSFYPNALLSFQNFRYSNTINGGTYEVTYMHNESQLEGLILHVLDFNDDEPISLLLDYRKDFFDEYEADAFLGAVDVVLEQLLKPGNTNAPLRDISLLNEKQYDQIIREFNASECRFPAGKSVADLFEEQVASFENKVAVMDREGSVTYGELNKKVNRIAHFLADTCALQHSEPVGVLLDRSAWTISAFLGILKAGGAYLPIDPEWPAQHIQFILDNTGCNKVLSRHQTENEHGFIYAGGNLSEKTDNPMRRTGPDDIAYVMYTSGSTGNPKGVWIMHKSIVRLVKDPNYVALNQDTRIFLTGALSFDSTTFEIWGALLNGGLLVIENKRDIVDVAWLQDRLARAEINTLWLTAGLFNQLADSEMVFPSSLKYLLVGGEQLSAMHINRAKKSLKNCQFINGYGPTENTTFSICHTIQKNYERGIPLGKPVSGTQVYILNAANHVLPIGAVGEICVSGTGVAKGYVNNPALTAERFIADPFQSGAQMYRTGDMGRWNKYGEVEYRGRLDNQVKINGNRIEPDEVRLALLENNKIEDAIVLVRTGSKSKMLIACIICNAFVSDLELKDQLKLRLPYYMIPAFYTRLNTFPLTANGKIDTKALLETFEQSHDDAGTAPNNNIQKEISDIWTDILNVKCTDIHANFFEVGGDSLRLIELHRVLLAKYKTTLKIADLFIHNTISTQSELLYGNKILANSELFVEI